MSSSTPYQDEADGTPEAAEGKARGPGSERAARRIALLAERRAQRAAGERPARVHLTEGEEGGADEAAIWHAKAKKRQAKKMRTKKGLGKKRLAKAARRDEEAAAPSIVVAPVAAPARMRRRHWGVIASFALMVLLPLAATGAYLWTMARDQYASTAGFTVRQEEGGAATELLGGFAAQLTGGAAGSDAGILYEYIQSQAMVHAIDEQIGLTEHYSQYYDEDPVFSLQPDPNIEQLLGYWSRMINISYDQSSGQVELRVQAFDAATATEIAELILQESQALVNDLNATARSDASRFAQQDLDEALIRLKAAREALTLFRTRTQIVDPETDLQGRMAVVNTLQAQLAQALVDLDILLERTNASDPRAVQAQRQIDVIRDRIDAERAAVAAGRSDVDGDDYPTLLAEYEGLVVDREFAEESYRAALAALDISRTNATRQTRYLATYISPTIPQSAEYPRRPVIFALAGMFLLLAWSILVLIYYSIRDSR